MKFATLFVAATSALLAPQSFYYPKQTCDSLLNLNVGVDINVFINLLKNNCKQDNYGGKDCYKCNKPLPILLPLNLNANICLNLAAGLDIGGGCGLLGC